MKLIRDKQFEENIKGIDLAPRKRSLPAKRLMKKVGNSD